MSTPSLHVEFEVSLPTNVNASREETLQEAFDLIKKIDEARAPEHELHLKIKLNWPSIM